MKSSKQRRRCSKRASLKSSKKKKECSTRIKTEEADEVAVEAEAAEVVEKEVAEAVEVAPEEAEVAETVSTRERDLMMRVSMRRMKTSSIRRKAKNLRLREATRRKISLLMRACILPSDSDQPLIALRAFSYK
jgi:hypothetical protein